MPLPDWAQPRPGVPAPHFSSLAARSAPSASLPARRSLTHPGWTSPSSSAGEPAPRSRHSGRARTGRGRSLPARAGGARGRGRGGAAGSWRSEPARAARPPDLWALPPAPGPEWAGMGWGGGGGGAGGATASLLSLHPRPLARERQGQELPTVISFCR